MYPIAITLSGLESGQIAVPDIAASLSEFNALLKAVLIEQAQFNTLSVMGKQRKIDPFPIVAGTQRLGMSGT